tara:strand:+ start:126 stop:1898 length:1773 start_codon:yes stop_codon:yes gene_type:complete
MSLEDESKREFLEILQQLSQDRGQPLDKVFTAWIAETIFGINNEEAIDSCIEIGKKNDFGIDFFHKQDDPSTEPYIAWGQAKFSEKFDYTLTREDLVDFVESIGHLESPPPSSNTTLKEVSDIFNTYKTRINSHKMIFVFCGEMNQQVKDLLNDPDWISKHKDPNTQFEFIGTKEILSFIKSPPTPMLSLKFNTERFEKEDVNSEGKSLVGYIKASEIAKIYDVPEIKNTINNLNTREFIGKTKFNLGIVETLKHPDRKKIFWKLNNGITATCEKIIEDPNEQNKFQFTNLKIVNGRQTSMTIWKNKDELDDSVEVKLIVHQTDDEDERSLISRFTNSQNSNRPSDLITNRKEISKLEIQFRKFGDWYFETQRGSYALLSTSEKNKIGNGVRRLEKEPMARKFLAYNGDPQFAINVSEQELMLVPGNLEKIFGKSTPESFIFPHIFYSYLERLESQWKTSSDFKEQEYSIFLHQRVVKFYILGFIKNSLDSIDSIERKKIMDMILSNYNNLNKDFTLDSKSLELSIKAFNTFLINWTEMKPDRSQKYDEIQMRKVLQKHDDFYNTLKEHQAVKSSTYPDAIKDSFLKFIS